MAERLRAWLDAAHRPSFAALRREALRPVVTVGDVCASADERYFYKQGQQRRQRKIAARPARPGYGADSIPIGGRVKRKTLRETLKPAEDALRRQMADQQPEGARYAGSNLIFGQL